MTLRHTQEEMKQGCSQRHPDEEDGGKGKIDTEKFKGFLCFDSSK